MKIMGFGDIKNGGRVGTGRRVLVAIKASGRLNHTMHGLIKSSMLDPPCYLTGLYGSYYPSASVFIIVRYVILSVFRIISSNLDIASLFGR